MKKHFINISYWVFISLLSSLFIYVGFTKVACDPDVLANMSAIGLPKSMTVLIGFVELMLGSLLWVRYFTKMAIQALVTMMVVATMFHLYNFGGGLHLIAPLTAMLGLLLTMVLGKERRNLQ
jgi:uncharacterized membrane protein YphA (DoxX/SURF4 family)